MNYVSEAKKYFSIFQVNHILYRKCRVNNIKERYYNKFHFSTKNSDYNNVSLNTKTTNETKNNNYDFSKPKYKIINSQPKRNLSVFGYNRGKFFHLKDLIYKIICNNYINNLKQLYIKHFNNK
ncbi:hypothetical protein [Plasmodium yoelii yoelii]|uniref:Uncharacterized protein n=1 Tax=Plasmodium yoelii yoelii TaxID=73239 RepID=Q7RNJ4_PLAYO|nr:hypothetical protein [Plasmodium yoelii yoelii]